MLVTPLMTSTVVLTPCFGNIVSLVVGTATDRLVVHKKLKEARNVFLSVYKCPD